MKNTNTTKATEAFKALQQSVMLKAGDTVKVIRKAQNYELGWQDVWDSDMDSSVGKSYKVKGLGEMGIELSNGFNYPFFVLEKTASAVVKPKPSSPRYIKLNSLYTAEVEKDRVKIGTVVLKRDEVIKLATQLI